MSLVVRKPDNMRSNDRLVESDVFGICERVKQLDPNLVVRLNEGHTEPWVILEIGQDGVERFVSRYSELDARIIEDLQRMLRIPFEQRFRATADRIDRENEERMRNIFDDEQMERLSWEMRRALRQSNMADIPDTAHKRPKRKRARVNG